MIKTYTYSMVALIPTEDREAHRFLPSVVGDETATVDYDGGPYVVLHALIDDHTYKSLYVQSMNKEEPLSECFITFKKLANTHDSVTDHKAATVAHHKTTWPDKYLGCEPVFDK